MYSTLFEIWAYYTLHTGHKICKNNVITLIPQNNIWNFLDEMVMLLSRYQVMCKFMWW